ncbi:MAG: site-specific DNA-methyltransferase [Candidatus Taylorbacteria bacterium]|nr:site-specific DNA-methyltransferase [Candidatus Taylorbacteria bacterium]
MKDVKIQNIFNEVGALLKKDKRLLDKEGEIIKNTLIEFIIKLDIDLITLLSKNKTAKQAFFVQVDGLLVFDKQKFLDFVNMSEFLPKSYTAFENQIGLASNKSLLANSSEVVLAFPYKDCVLEGGQEKVDEKRDEVFFNTTLAPDEIDRLRAPKALVNWKKYDEKGEHELKQWDGKDNLVLRGNNLFALYSLLPKYRGKVKLIYIDPPYNTGSDDFMYNDKFNHSTWLVFMKNRLEIAKELLQSDGSIFISLDDSEVHYCKVLADEIFGRENYLSSIAYQRSGSAGLGQGGKFVVNTAESILVYAKNKIDFVAYNLDGGVPLEEKHMKRYNGVLENEGKKTLLHSLQSKSNGEDVKIYKHTGYKISSISLATFEKNKNDILKKYFENFDKIFRLNIPQVENQFQHSLIQKMTDNELYSVEYTASRGKSKDKAITNFYYKKQLIAWLKSSAYIKENEIIKTNKLTDFWAHGDIPKADLANEGGVTLSRGKKPEQLLKRIIDLASQEGDLILDYHLGSGTTCAVAHKMGRRYIGVEQLHYGDNDAISRLQNVIRGDKSGVSKGANWKGGGSFVYAELFELNAKYVTELDKAKTTKVILDVYQKMKDEAFFRYEVDFTKFDEKTFAKLNLNEQKKILLDCLDANHFYVNYSDIDDATFKINPKDKLSNKEFYK